jgi:hypothetical protein
MSKIKNFFSSQKILVIIAIVLIVTIGAIGAAYAVTSVMHDNDNITPTPRQISSPTPTVTHAPTPTPVSTQTATPTQTPTHTPSGGSGGGGGGSTQHANPFTISHIAGTGVWYESVWTINAYPGETNFITLRVSNSNHVSLIAYANVSGNCSTIYGAGNYTVPANGFKDITFTLVVNSSAIPKTYVSYITISMQN